MKSGNGGSSGRKRKKPEPCSGFLRFLALLFSWPESLLGHADEVGDGASNKRTTKRAAEESARSQNLVQASCAFLRCSFRGWKVFLDMRMKSANGGSSGRKRKKPEPCSGFLRFLPLLSSWPESLLEHADEAGDGASNKRRLSQPRKEQRKKAQEARTWFRLLALSCAALFVVGKFCRTCRFWPPRWEVLLDM